MRRVRRLLQEVDPEEQAIRVQGQDRGCLPGGQDPQEPVQGLPAQEVRRGRHEQGRSPARARAQELNLEAADVALLQGAGPH